MYQQQRKLRVQFTRTTVRMDTGHGRSTICRCASRISQKANKVRSSESGKTRKSSLTSKIGKTKTYREWIGVALMAWTIKRLTGPVHATSTVHPKCLSRPKSKGLSRPIKYPRLNSMHLLNSCNNKTLLPLSRQLRSRE